MAPPPLLPGTFAVCRLDPGEAVPAWATGVLASLLTPLATAGVSVFSLSTYDTDYLLVREGNLERAMNALRAAGHTVRSDAEPN